MDTSVVLEQSYEQITANLAGKVRRERFNDRDYLVAPLTMIVPGVLNGSKGPLFYPDEECKKNPTAWNHMPIVVNHPEDESGNPVSARSPKVLAKQGIGFVFEATHNGKTQAEGWFDVLNTRRVDNRVLQRLEAGQPLELSTGLFTANEPRSGVFNGVQYTHVARNHLPDHLAVFVDKKGACSLEDGCGVLVNEKSAKGLFDKFMEWVTQSPATNQINPTKEESSDMAGKLSEQDKKRIVDNLIANCDCANKETTTNAGPWIEADRAVLNGFSDERITALEESRKQIVANSRIVANARKGIEHGDTVLTLNEATGIFEAKPKHKADDGLVDNLDTANLQPGDTAECVFVGNVRKYRIKKGQLPTVNTQHPAAKPQTDEEWFKSAPPGIQSVVRNAMIAEAQEKEQLIERILTNDANPFSKEQLQKFPLVENGEGTVGLRTLAQFAGTGDDGAQQHYNLPSYLGAAAPVSNRRRGTKDDNFKNEDLDMAPPTINWAEENDKRKTA